MSFSYYPSMPGGGQLPGIKKSTFVIICVLLWLLVAIIIGIRKSM
jgi:hypothetical protein